MAVEASFAMKLWGATYYMTASMIVQLMNKVPAHGSHWHEHFPNLPQLDAAQPPACTML